MIGLDEAIANVKGKIVDNHTLAMAGMGGIGKTTLVKKLYHQIHANFFKSSFLENVKKIDIVEVLKQNHHGLVWLEIGGSHNLS